MPRPRIQTGQLLACGPEGSEFWSGRFYVYTGDKAVRRTVRLGWKAELSRTDALNKMARMIGEANNRAEKMAVMNSEPGELTTLGSHAKGDIAEMLTCIDLMKRGFEVFRHASEFASCDMVAMANGTFIRVEVKYAGANTRYYRNGKFDVLARVGADGSVSYFDHRGERVLNWAATDHEVELSA